MTVNWISHITESKNGKGERKKIGLCGVSADMKEVTAAEN